MTAAEPTFGSKGRTLPEAIGKSISRYMHILGSYMYWPLNFSLPGGAQSIGGCCFAHSFSKTTDMPKIGFPDGSRTIEPLIIQPVGLSTHGFPQEQIRVPSSSRCCLFGPWVPGPSTTSLGAATAIATSRATAPPTCQNGKAILDSAVCNC